MRALLRLFLAVGGLALTIIILYAISLRDRRPPIYFAVEKGDTNAITQYLASGNNVNDPIVCYIYGARRAPLLDIAAEEGQLNAVKFLLSKGANPNQTNFSGDTPLISVFMGRVEVLNKAKLEILKTLLNAGANPNLKSSSDYGWTPLMQAAELSQVDMAGILLTAGADVNETNNIGQTALHLAGNAEVVQLLLAAGADRITRDANGMTPADMANWSHRFDVLAVLTNAPVRKH